MGIKKLRGMIFAPPGNNKIKFRPLIGNRDLNSYRKRIPVLEYESIKPEKHYSSRSFATEQAVKREIKPAV